MATGVPTFGITRLIFSIAFLIILVQIISLIHLSSREDNLYNDRSRRLYHNDHHEIDFVYNEDKNHKIIIENYNKRPIKSQQQDEKESIPLLAPEIRCVPSHKDAKSALKRVKSTTCKNKLIEIICLGQEDKLYWNNITRFCPVDRSKGRPSHSIETKIGYGPPIRILYALVVHGRAFRQVKRLFKALFHTNHYFYFHVDSGVIITLKLHQMFAKLWRSDYLHREVQDLAKGFSNVAVSDWRMATIWGGASLLQMLLRMMSDGLKIKDWQWDFFLNLSASDYPVQSNEKLSEFMRAHREENFLKPHGGKVEKFIKKQGISRTFYECHEHMWRLGERKLPETIDFDGGSDWIALNRKFVDYVVNSQDSLVTGLKHLYQFALLPAESFFHVVLRNSKFCETYAKGNLRLTNWKRKLGCRCQYKHIVDWCGCSPNDFKPEDLVRLQSQTINHFARKFEPIVNNEIINLLDEWLYGKPSTPILSRDKYWENLYHYKDDNNTKFDVQMSFFQSFARISTERLTLSSDCHFLPIWRVKEATLLMRNDSFEGILVTFDVKVIVNAIQRQLIEVESFFKPKLHTQMFNNEMEEPASRLKSLIVGTNWDQKERIFRNIAGLIGPYDNPTLVHRWVHGKEFFVRIVWQDPLNVIAGMYQMKVENNWVISFHKPTFTKPIRPGTWTVKITYNDNVVLGVTQFLVIPQSYFNGKEATLEKVIPANNGPPAGLYSSDFVIEFDREANDTQRLVQEFSEHSSSIGTKLDSWTDGHVLYHWVYSSTCALLPKRFMKCGGMPVCKETEWSSRFPDPKSEITAVNNLGRLR